MVYAGSVQGEAGGAMNQLSDTSSLAAADRGVDRDDTVGVEEVEDIIAGIWEEVLKTDDFGYEDNFFDVGGNSLLVPIIRRKLMEALPGGEVRLVDMLKRPTIRQLAAFLHEKGRADGVSR